MFDTLSEKLSGILDGLTLLGALSEPDQGKVRMASIDTRRPAAMEQLAVLGQQVNVPTLPIVEGQTPVQIAARAIQAAKLGGYDVVLLDTAGRLTLDDEMLNEAA